jgi:quercetin 2,3-dioxygenase
VTGALKTNYRSLDSVSSFHYQSTERKHRLISLRQRNERGQTRIDWLESYHTFSFGDYYDPRYTGFADLRVINDDRVQPGKGFSMHQHQDMEIITYVLEGTLAHKDSLGNGSLIRSGEVQRMSAGTGILHSEFNPSDTEAVHFLQIWLMPQCQGRPPAYEQKIFKSADRMGQWQLFASPDGLAGSLAIDQDASLWAARLEAEHNLTYEAAIGRACWLQVAYGVLQMNGQLLEAGDGMAISDERLTLEGISRESEVLLFDLRKPKPIS